MALDPALELQELDAILGSADDPETKRARIAMLYEQPAQNDPSAGLPPEALAQFGGGGGGAGGMGSTGAPPGNVPDVPVAAPGAGGASGMGGGGGSGGTLGQLPPEILAQSGTSGPGNMPSGVPIAPPMAATDAPPIRPAPARVTAIPETTVRGAPKKPGSGAPAPGTPEWLTQSMQAEGLDTGRAFPKEPIGRPVSGREDSAYRSLEEEMLAQTREQGEAERQAILSGAQAEVDAIERGQIVDAEMAKREMDRQRQLESMERDYGEMLAEADAEPIDSERLWNSKSTGEKILSKIALFIGTIGAAGLGDPKMMMAKMDADVDRDIAAQKANKAFKLHKLAAKGSLYDMARSRFGSEQAVDQAMRETAWRKIDAQLKQFHTVAQDPARQAAIEQLMAQTEGKIVDQERQRRMLNEADTIARMRAQAAAGAPKPVRADLAVTGWGQARDPKSAGAARELAAANEEVGRYLNELEQMKTGGGAQFGAWGIGSKEYQEAQALRARMVPGIAKVMAGGFAPSETDMERAEGMVPNPSSWGNAKFEAQIGSLRKGSRNQVEGFMKQYIRGPGEK